MEKAWCILPLGVADPVLCRCCAIGEGSEEVANFVPNSDPVKTYEVRQPYMYRGGLDEVFQGG